MGVRLGENMKRNNREILYSSKNQAKYPCKSKSSKTISFITQTDANNNVCVISSSLLVNVHHSHKGSHNSSID